MKLRAYGPGDFAGLFALDKQCFPPGIAYSRDEMAFFLRSPESWTVIAEHDGQIAGFLITQTYRARVSYQARIITIDVAPDARRLGVGKRLMAACEQHLKSQQVRTLRLEVAIDNTAAQRFYEGQGFREIGRLPRYYSDTLDGLVMQKQLG